MRQRMGTTTRPRSPWSPELRRSQLRCWLHSEWNVTACISAPREENRRPPPLAKRTPPGIDPRLGGITVDHLLSMRAGLERTSGRQNYGRWVNSPNWIAFALTRPFYDRPGGMMLYSTGNTHLLSAILTDASG